MHLHFYAEFEEEYKGTLYTRHVHVCSCSDKIFIKKTKNNTKRNRMVKSGFKKRNSLLKLKKIMSV